jgi:hypothetical protein
MTKYIQIIYTLCGKETAWWNEDNGKRTPVVFNTERKAQLKLLEDYYDLLGDQIEQFKSYDREFEDIDLQCEEGVEECDVKEDGTVVLMSGEEFKPTQQ